MVLGGLLLLKNAEQFAQRVEMLVHYAFFQRNDGIIRDPDAFRAHVCAALRDIAVTDAVVAAKVVQAVLSIEGMHFERRGVDEKARPDKLIVERMLAQDMAYVLAKITLDALPKLLDPVYVLLRHAPRSIGCVGRPRFKGLNPDFYAIVPRNICDEIFYRREAFHGLYCHWLIERQRVEPRH